MTRILTDTFTRPDSSTGIGTPDTGQTYTIGDGTHYAGISGNTAYSPWAAGQQVIEWVDVAVTDMDSSFDITVTAGNGGGNVYRYTDVNNHYLFDSYSGGNGLYKIVAGAYTLLISAGSTTTGTFRTTVSGTTHTVYVNGVSQGSVTDSAFTTQTKAGLRLNHPTMRLDNLTVDSIGAATATGAVSFKMGVTSASVAVAVVTGAVAFNMGVAGTVAGAVVARTGAVAFNWSVSASAVATASGSVSFGMVLTGAVPGTTYAPKVEIAFVNDPYGTLVWTDVSAYVTDWTTKRGKNYDLGTPQAGVASVTLIDPDGRFDPGNTAGVYYPNVRPRVPIRVTTTTGGVTYNLWRGQVERWPRSWRLSGALTEVQITATDAFTTALNVAMPIRFQDQVNVDVGTGYFYRFIGGSTNDNNAHGSEANPFMSPYLTYTYPSGSLAGAAVDNYMHVTFPANASPPSGLSIFGGYPAAGGHEAYFRVTAADTNVTHSTIFLTGDGKDASYPFYAYRTVALTHSATASSGYQLVLGTAQTTGSTALASVVSTYGDIAINARYQIAIVPLGPMTYGSISTVAAYGGGYLIYVNGTLWYDGTTDTQLSSPFGPTWGTNGTDNPWPVGFAMDYDEAQWYTTAWANPAPAGLLTPALVQNHWVLSGISGGVVGDYPAQATGARINAILDTIHWPTGQRVTDTGLSTIAASGSLSGHNALDLLLDAMNVELGNLFIDGQGRVVFQNRTHRNGAAVAVTFGDSTGEVPYAADVVVEYDDRFVYNMVTITQTLAALANKAIAYDQTSQTAYGSMTYAASLPIVAVADCQGMANTLLARYKDAHQRVEKVTIDLASQPSFASVVLARDIGDVIRFRRRPPGNSAIDINNSLEGVSISYQHDPRVFAVTFELDPLPSNATY